ncbi:hypothetical protein Anas_11895 [Armadillidium nasatum]|uniref:Uncharacterized protein n=1 Tax=Armadillidium nasatum TaxID=96803 RepID=A0A5N5SLG2_9CRUS|nr:hypothetical protein Anas_11895 [Armadillidium nasatum]
MSCNVVDVIGLDIGFTSNSASSIQVNWIDDTNEDELKEVMKWRLDYVNVTLDLLVKKKQFHQALELCQFLVDLYQFDTRLIGVTSYYNHIDLPSHLRAIGEYVLEKQNCQQFMLKFQNLIFSFIRNGIVIPKFIRELPILQHIFSNTLMQYEEQVSHLSRPHPYVPRRQGRRNYPFRNDVVRNGNNEIIGAVAGPSQIHARVEWPRNHRRFNYNYRRRNFK